MEAYKSIGRFVYETSFGPFEGVVDYLEAIGDFDTLQSFNKSCSSFNHCVAANRGVVRLDLCNSGFGFDTQLQSLSRYAAVKKLSVAISWNQFTHIRYNIADVLKHVHKNGLIKIRICLEESKDKELLSDDASLDCSEAIVPELVTLDVVSKRAGDGNEPLVDGLRLVENLKNLTAPRLTALRFSQLALPIHLPPDSNMWSQITNLELVNCGNVTQDTLLAFSCLKSLTLNMTDIFQAPAYGWQWSCNLPELQKLTIIQASTYHLPRSSKLSRLVLCEVRGLNSLQDIAIGNTRDLRYFRIAQCGWLFNLGPLEHAMKPGAVIVVDRMQYPIAFPKCVPGVKVSIFSCRVIVDFIKHELAGCSKIVVLDGKFYKDEQSTAVSRYLTERTEFASVQELCSAVS